MSLETPDPWMPWTRFGDPLRLGLLVGTIFGTLNMMFSWLFPLSDDTIAALLRFSRFRASEFSSLRAFVTLEYVRDAPLKIGTASTII